MAAGYLLQRVLLKFQEELVLHDLSTIAFAHNQLWTASDETNSIERLSETKPWIFGNHRSFKLKDLLDNFDDAAGEVDIEGLDCADDSLWLIGSHSTKRKKVKQGKIEKLKSIKAEPNRYLLARIPLANGELVKSDGDRQAACLKKEGEANQLIAVLREDEYLAPFLAESSHAQKALPGKDNGFDIEGLAVRKDKIFIGLRGPVLRGIALLLELEVMEEEPGILALKPDKHGNLYKRHFLDLDGLGIRELCFDNHDLLVLSGPTMELDGTLRLFRLKKPYDLSHDSYTDQQEQLMPLFDIPYGRGTDKAEGICRFPSLDRSNSLLVVYDSPGPERLINNIDVFADIFTIE